jgi:hypothetical protein
MKRFLSCVALTLLACEDAPPSGSGTLSTPTDPVYFKVGQSELLAFIDQGHEAVRLLDLSAGTYQWGDNPYFARAVTLDDSPVDVEVLGDELFALSASGQVFAVPSELASPVSLGLPLTSDSERSLALLHLGATLVRLDRNCTLTRLDDGLQIVDAQVTNCASLGASLVLGEEGGVRQIFRLAESGLVPFAAESIALRSAHAALDGGFWLLSSDLRRLLRIDASGAELRRFVAPYDVMDLVEVEDESGPLLCLAGLDRGVVYLRADGVAEEPHGSRAFTRPVALRGSFQGLNVSRDIAETLLGRDLLAVGGLQLGDVEIQTQTTDDGGLLLVANEGAELPTEPRPWVTLVGGEAICTGRLGADGLFEGNVESCPVGDQVTATFLSAAWHLFAGTALEKDAEFLVAESLGLFAEGQELNLDGHVFSASAPASAAGAVVALRGRNGAGSSVLSDGWFGGITAGTAKTNYAESEQVWLWLTSPSENAIVQMPVKAAEYYSMLIFR